MTIASDHSAPARVAFRTSAPAPVGDPRAWGYLETSQARVGVVYHRAPQPHLTFYPPVRAEEGLDAFLEECLARAHNGHGEWGRLSVDPIDGEVSLRANLASGEGAEIERALEEAADFFEQEYGALAKACLPDRCPEIEEEEEDPSGIMSLIERFLDR